MQGVDEESLPREHTVCQIIKNQDNGCQQKYNVRWYQYTSQGETEELLEYILKNLSTATGKVKNGK